MVTDFTDDMKWNSRKRFLKKDRPWSDYPIGTKAHAFDGGHWVRVERGWKWMSGDTFPTPGADAIGECIELTSEDDL